MKYVSLIELMRLYGRSIMECHSVLHLDYRVTSRALQSDIDYRPFAIESKTDAETGQVLNTLAFNCDVDKRPLISYTAVPDAKIVLPPILEVEWLKGVLDLGDETVEVLNQLGYMLTAWPILYTWASEVGRTADNEGIWMDFLEDEDVIMEVETLKDTAKILAARPLPRVELPKIKSWNTIMVYAAHFPNLIERCKNQSVWVKEIYYHMPVLLALFMRDYCSDGLDGWSKHARLAMESTLQKDIHELITCIRDTSQAYTYGMSMSMTAKDIEFLRLILTIIYDKIHELNVDIGLISFSEYKNVSGPEAIRADVRLSGMRIDWDRELRRVEEEKKKQAEAEKGQTDQVDAQEGGSL